GGYGQTSNQATECQGTGIAHKDFCWSRIPPQKAQGATQTSGSQDGQVQRVAYLVAPSDEAGFTGVAELPERDDGVRAHDKGGRACRQAIEAIGEVDGIRPRGNQDVHKHQENNDADDGGSNGDIKGRNIAHKGQVRSRRG